MSESNIMMVNPNEIVIDMPVDEQNVTQKMESMKERGIIQPVTLWLQGMRVIDGFHRTVAAQRLGWDEIPCYVVDCSEDAFWDARIQSARQHHRIENERLNAWMMESWKTTEWYKPSLIDPQLRELYTSIDSETLSVTLSIIETLWTLYRKGGSPVLHEALSGRNSEAHQVNAKLAKWIESKAKRWGIRETDIIEKIFSAYPKLLLGRNMSGDKSFLGMELDELSRDLNLTFSERQKLVSKADIGVASLERGEIYDFKDWAKSQAKKSADNQIFFSDYIKLKRKAEEEEREAQKEAAHALYMERQRFLQTPQGQAEAHKQKVQTVKEAMERVVWTAESVDHLIADSQEFSLPVAEAIATLTDFHNEHFKRKDTKIKDLVTARNAQLRRDVKALTQKIESLERALNAKQVVTPRLPNVMVEHGN